MALIHGPLAFAELARRIPDPPKQIARDVLDLAERRLIEMEPETPEITRLEITDRGKQLLETE